MTLRDDPSLVEVLRRLSDETAASECDREAKAFEASQKLSFSRIGVILAEVETRSLWRLLASAEGIPYHSMGAWMATTMPCSNGTAYSALGCARDLSGIPLEIRQNIPRCNQETLRKLSPETRQRPEIIEAARDFSEKDFQTLMEADHPEQHIEFTPKYILNPDKGQREVFEAAVSAVRVIEQDESMTREQCLQEVAQTYLDFHQGRLQQSVQQRKGMV